MSEFAIPKEKVSVAIRFANGTWAEGTIFIEHSQTERTMQQKIFSFMEDGCAFFPFLLSANGILEFISKSRILALQYILPSDEEDVNLMHIESIAAIMPDGSEIAGMLTEEVPREQSRLSDCLNLSNKFLNMRAGHKAWCVNKKLIVKVTGARRK